MMQWSNGFMFFTSPHGIKRELLLGSYWRRNNAVYKYEEYAPNEGGRESEWVKLMSRRVGSPEEWQFVGPYLKHGRSRHFGAKFVTQEEAERGME